MAQTAYEQVVTLTERLNRCRHEYYMGALLLPPSASNFSICRMIHRTMKPCFIRRRRSGTKS